MWVLLAVAFSLRLGLVLATLDAPVTFDPADFDRTGLAIARGQGYPPSNRAPDGGPSAFRPPAYPLFLAGVYCLVHYDSPAAARLFEVLLGTLAAGLVGVIARQLWGRRIGRLAFGIAAVAPPMVVLSTALVSEALFVPVVLGALAAALRARRSEHPLRWSLLAGGLCGLAALTRTNGAILVLPLALAVWSARPRWRWRALRAPVVLVVAAVLAVAPWTIRNALVLHAFVPVSDEVGYTLAGTYDQASRQDTHWPAVWKEAEHGASPEYAPIVAAAVTHAWNEVELGRRLERQALREIAADPGYVAEVALYNSLRIFHLGELDFAVANLHDSGIQRVPAWLAIYGFYPLALLALAGALTRRARRAPRWLWLFPLLLAATVLVTGFVRFRAPIDPFLAMLAALALARLGQRRLEERAPPDSASSTAWAS